MSFAIKYRPKTFGQVIGQDLSVRILKNSMAMDRVPNGVLFSGIRGTGKTTLARIFAKALNCSNFAGEVCGRCQSCLEADRGTNTAILEIDAASHNGVDDIRDLEMVARQMCDFSRHVVILDEAHQLSKSAQAALLKILEEPPAGSVFLLSTTDPQKLEDTIRSRCLSMPLRSMSASDVEQSLRWILETEGLEYENGFVEQVAMHGGGSMRDCQKILDQAVLAAGGGKLTVEGVADLVGIIGVQAYKDLAAVLVQKDVREAFTEVRRWQAEGVDLQILFDTGIPTMVRDLTLFLHGMGGAVPYSTGIPHESFVRNVDLKMDEVKRFLGIWDDFATTMRTTSNPRLIWDLFFTAAFA